MCGIAGIVNLDDQPVKGIQLVKINDALRHRGPDDEGYVLIQQHTGHYVEFSGQDSPQEMRDAYPMMTDSQNLIAGNIGLAHRRFSIIDLTVQGHQPFFDSAKECCVIFNGEIYNYIEIREELKRKGHIFHSNSDTEAIVEAYKTWGFECFTRMNGMWALALYDFKRRVLIVSRDRLGKMPLYWTKSGDAVYFASEIKALLQIPVIAQAKAVNEAAIYPYLAHGLRDLNNTTFFDGIYSLPAASWAVVDRDFPNNIHHYWHVPASRLQERDISLSEATDAILGILEDAVRIRLRADVPWCVELSGGMDSSVLVALASQLSGQRLITYTVRFPDKEWNEEPFARSVGHHYGTDHRVIDSPLENFWHEILPFTYLEEEPYHAPNLHTNQIIRRMMRADGIKMLLNGAGGDELFAGYPAYFSQVQVENLLAGRISAYFDNGLHWSERSSAIRSLSAPVIHLIRRTAKAALGSIGVKPSRHRYIKVNDSKTEYGFTTLSECLYSDITNTKMPYWLRSGDKTRMGVPTEARAPFLDYRMVELAFSLPVTYLIRDGWHKWILRKAFEDLLPQDVVWREKKMGFPFPFQRFFSTSHAIIQMILQEARNPYTDLSSPTELDNNWRLLSFLLWYELFFNSNQTIFCQIADLHRPTTASTDYGFLPGFLTSDSSLS